MTAPLLARVARAIHLDVERLDAERWLVRGGASTHVVDAHRGRCDCPDCRIRGRVCKHLLRVHLAQGDADTLALLRAVVPMPRRGRSRA
jgi:hypothetical protein